MSGHPMAKGYQSVDKLETILSDQPLNQVIKVEREDLERTTWYAKAQFKQSSNYIGTSLLLSLSLILTATLLFIVTFRTKQKIANQNLEPIVTTPVDKVEAQSTQAHV